MTPDIYCYKITHLKLPKIKPEKTGGLGLPCSIIKQKNYLIICFSYSSDKEWETFFKFLFYTELLLPKVFHFKDLRSFIVFPVAQSNSQESGMANRSLKNKLLTYLRWCFIKSASTMSAKGKLNKLNEAWTITLKKDNRF